jgi:hypothetical protein
MEEVEGGLVGRGGLLGVEREQKEQAGEDGKGGSEGG